MASRFTVSVVSREASSNVITFKSLQEQTAWVEDRRRKRFARAFKFGLKPSPDQVSAHVPTLDPAAVAVAAAAAAAAAVYTDEQTRHARRLYVGNLPPLIKEKQICRAFTDAITNTLQPGSGIDPAEIEKIIVSVYLHDKKHFCFLEFKTVEWCSACMELDGLEVMPGQPTVKVNRPTDYKPALAPPETNKPVLDVSKLGIIGRTVLDGPDKIVTHGWHHNLQESQVLKILQAFGEVKAFHLFKNKDDIALKRGFCFVQYVDPARTPVAVAGLNGMVIEGGKALTAQLHCR